MSRLFGLKNSSALKPPTLSISLSNRVLEWVTEEVSSGGRVRGRAGHGWIMCWMWYENAIKNMHSKCSKYCVTDIGSERNALFTPNTITEMPTVFMTFRNIMLQFWLVYSNVDDADILFPVRKILMLLQNSFDVQFCYWCLLQAAVCYVSFRPLACIVLPGRLELFSPLLVTACNQL